MEGFPSGRVDGFGANPTTFNVSFWSYARSEANPLWSVRPWIQPPAIDPAPLPPEVTRRHERSHRTDLRAVPRNGSRHVHQLHPRNAESDRRATAAGTGTGGIHPLGSQAATDSANEECAPTPE